jgi:hypothetical protein
MKKQLLIAAVAATMTSVAFADVSITGQMKANYKSTDTAGTNVNTVTTETNLYVAGQSGDTKVHIELDMDSADGAGGDMDVEDVWMSTKIAGATVKAGTWNGSDSLLGADAARATGKFAVTLPAMGGVTASFDGSADANKNVVLAASVAGVDVSYKIDDGSQNEVKLSTTVQGVKIAYHNIADSDVAATATGKSSLMVSGTVQGLNLTYAQAETDANATINGDSYFGDTATYKTPVATGSDVSAFGISTSLAGNTVSAKQITVDNTGTNTDITKFVVTRPLAGGATLEVTYTDEDTGTTASTRETLDVELAVKF